MKHFFFSYDESFELADPLKEYVNRRSAPKDDKALKVYYDVADIISDKRFEQNDKLLEVLVKATKKDAPGSGKKKSDSKKDEHLRLQGLEKLWDVIERQYKLFTMDNKETQNHQFVDMGCFKG